MASYWAKYASSRISRRRVLIGSAAGLGAAALMTACSMSDGPREAGSSGLLSQAADTTSKAKPGGVYKGLLTVEPATLDPMTTSTVFAFSGVAHYTYPRLIKFKAVEAPKI